MVLQNYQNLYRTDLKCPHKIHLKTQCPLITSVSNFIITIKNFYTSKKSIRVYQNWEFMPFNLAWNSTTDIFDQHSLFCHFVLHIAVNTNVSEGFVFTAIWSTYMEGRPADRFVLHIAVNTILPKKNIAVQQSGQLYRINEL